MLRFEHNLFDSSTIRKTYKKGANIYQEGNNAQVVFRVMEGRVKIWKNNPELNRKIILYIVHPFELFGVIDFFNKSKTRRCVATAMDNKVVVQYIPFSEFKRNIVKDHRLNFAIIQSLIMNYELCWERFRELTGREVNLKVYRAIQKLAKDKGIVTETGIVLKGIKQQELADYIGVSRQSVTAAMVQYKKEGKIDYDRDRILIKQRN